MTTIASFTDEYGNTVALKSISNKIDASRYLVTGPTYSHFFNGYEQARYQYKKCVKELKEANS